MATKKQILTEIDKKQENIAVFCKISYFDKKLGRNVYFGEIIEVGEKRAKELEGKGLVTIFLE